MDTKKLIIIIVVSFLISGCYNQKLDSDQDSFDNDLTVKAAGELPWDFPVKPGTEGWKQFKTRQEMVDACQIPAHLLSSLSTSDLTDICLGYPLLNNFVDYNGWNNGLDVLFEDFNGVRELFKREDASKELVKRYRAKVENLPASLAETGSTLRFMELEGLLSRYQAKSAAANENYREILRNLAIGYGKKTMFPEYFGALSLGTNLFAATHIILKMYPQSIEMISSEELRIIYSGHLPGEETFNIINELCNQLIQ